jgi:hypothetical protein
MKREYFLNDAMNFKMFEKRIKRISKLNSLEVNIRKFGDIGDLFKEYPSNTSVLLDFLKSHIPEPSDFIVECYSNKNNPSNKKLVLYKNPEKIKKRDLDNRQEIFPGIPIPDFIKKKKMKKEMYSKYFATISFSYN